MSNIVQATNEDIVRLSSTEVKDMMEIRHDNLIAKIEKHTEILTNLKIKVSEFWIEGTYRDATGRTLKDYKVSKKGCEFLAHKTTGVKGDLFTIKYMDRFEQMEKELSNPFKGLSRELQAIFTIDKKQQEIEIKVNEVKTELDDLRDNAPLYNIECHELIKAVKKSATNALGGYKSNAYKNKSLRAKVYQDIQHQLRREFAVDSYKAIKRCQLEAALKITNEYELPFCLEEQVVSFNNQIEFA